MRTFSRSQTRWILVLALLAGAGLRLYGLNNLSPPGLEHDEVANWLIDREILAGNHAIYFTEAYGHEAAFHYLQAGFVALLGDNALALRLPAAFLGLLCVPIAYVLAKRLFGLRIALIAALLLAVLFWPVFYSRLALRGIMLPVLSGLSAIFWWRGWHAGGDPSGVKAPAPTLSLPFFLSGLFAGLSIHTYMAARAVPIFYGLFLIYLALFHRERLKQRWRGVFVFWLMMVLVAAPLIIYLLANPAAEYRISEVDAPLRALLQGDPNPVVDNSVDILGMFGFAGDPLWRQNVAPEPVFDPLLAVFFYLCLLLCIVYVHNAHYVFLILWVLTSSIPSILTIDAPSSIRIINIFPVLTLLPAIVIHNLGHLSTKKWQLSTALVDKFIFPVLLSALVLFHGARTARFIFVTWSAHAEVRFVWQEALTNAAAYLDQRTDSPPVAIGGWTPDSMDAPTMDLTLRREDLTLRYFYPQEALLIPAGVPGETRLILHPTILPLHPLLQVPLQRAGIAPVEEDGFTYYVVENDVNVAPDVVDDAVFGNELAFLGHTITSDCYLKQVATCQLVTYWQVRQRADGERRFFLHALDADGNLIANGDGLDAPAAYWQVGDLIMQRHELSVATIEPSHLEVGVYNPQTGVRLATSDGPDAIRLRAKSVK